MRFDGAKSKNPCFFLQFFSPLPSAFLRHAEEQSIMIVISFAIAQAASRLRATEGSREIYTTENMKDQFTTIATFLSEADPADLASMTFNDLCRRHGASPRCMNNLFYDRFGMSGDEIIFRLTVC